AMDGDPIAIARMYEQHARFLQIENNTLHRDLSAKYADCLALRKENAADGKQLLLSRARWWAGVVLRGLTLSAIDWRPSSAGRRTARW
ncbi:MAG TPA: hypothetical protein VMV94_10570, partial [Phycisphaerae bacterium]|nr:hypothetical protein [Phycisphaerae bacterium]